MQLQPYTPIVYVSVSVDKAHTCIYSTSSSHTAASAITTPSLPPISLLLYQPVLPTHLCRVCVEPSIAACTCPQQVEVILQHSKAPGGEVPAVAEVVNSRGLSNTHRWSSSSSSTQQGQHEE